MKAILLLRRDTGHSPMTLTLTYDIKVIILNDLQQILAVARYSLKSS